MGAFKNEDARNELLSSVPTDSDFNPYDYISQDNYRLNRRGKAQYQEDLAKLLYLAQINQENRMNEYNSPSAQAARMRAAGINPDITGVENHGASNVAGYQGNPMDGVKSNMDIVGDSLGIISGVANIAVGMITGAQQISANSVQNILSGIQSSGAISDFFASDPTVDTAKKFIDTIPGLSRSQRRKVYKSYLSTFGSMRNDTAYNNFFAAWNESRGRSHKSALDPYNFPVDDLTPEQYIEIWEPYISALKSEAIKKLYETESAGHDRDIKKFQKETLDTYRLPLMKVFNKLDSLGDVGLYLKAALSAFIINGITD